MSDDAALAELDTIDEQGRPVLSPGAPLNSAKAMISRRFMVNKARTLHHQQGTFYRWSGVHYEEVAREVIRAEIYEFLDGALRQEGKSKVEFDPNQTKVAHVLEALAAETQIAGNVRAPAWLNGECHAPATEFLPVKNGLLHLPTRALVPATPAFFGLNAVGYAYDRTATKPVEWLKFLESIWPADKGKPDKASIATLQELFGLLLTGDTAHQKAFLIVGPKRSGKGTIARVLTAMLGKENVAGPTLSSLTQNFGLQALIGKPLAIISDARLGGRADSSIVVERLLTITGEDAINVDRKYREEWTGRLPTRFVILTNELPRLNDASGALASRFIILSLTESFFGREDAGLTNRLLGELPAILKWAMDGRDRLAKRGYFVQPRSGAAAAEELADLTSPVGAFVRDECETGAGFSVLCEGLFGAWLGWCSRQGREHPGTLQNFGRELRAAVPWVEVARPRGRGGAGNRLRCYVGLKLRFPGM